MGLPALGLGQPGRILTASAIYTPFDGSSAKHLIEPSVAERVVRFVAAPKHQDEALEKLDLEPALLSVFCRELNSKRQRLDQSHITEDLLENSGEEILNIFYEGAMADSVPETSAFVEEQLLNLSGCRESVTVEEALTFPGVTHDAIDRMVDRRLIGKKEKGGVERLELVHDLLAPVICRSRGRRRQLEAEELPEKEAIETGRNRHSKKRTRSAWRLFWLSAGWAVVLLVALYASLGYPFNRTECRLRRWITLVLARTIRGPWASSRPGSAPMRTVWTTWSGCDGPLASLARTAATMVAGGWAMGASGAPGAAAVVR